MSQKDYTLHLDSRKELSTGSVKYEIRVICDDTDTKIVDTTYTISRRHEDPETDAKNFKEMIQSFAEKKALEHENNIGHDYSGEKFDI